MELGTNIQIYQTHNNGGRPYQVNISGNNVEIYSLKSNKFHSSYQAKKIFIGKSPLNKMTEFSGGHGDNFDGNSILLHLHDNTYLFIGDTIFSFVSYANIVEYISQVGNNDVPYPYAIDIDGNIYLMIEDVVLKQNTKIKKYDNNPYWYYYDENKIIDYNNKLNTFGITEYYINDDKYTLRYHPYPKNNYDSLTEDDETMYTIDINNSKDILTKEMYISLMERFGEQNNFMKLLNKIIYEPLPKT